MISIYEQKIIFSTALIWTLLAIILLIIGLTQGEARMGAEMLMMFLGFPCGLLVPDIVIRFFPQMGIGLFDIHGSVLQYIIEWLMLFGIGILQWFILPYFVWYTLKQNKK